MVLFDIEILQKEKLIGSWLLTPTVSPCQPPHSESSPYSDPSRPPDPVWTTGSYPAHTRPLQ